MSQAGCHEKCEAGVCVAFLPPSPVCERGVCVCVRACAKRVPVPAAARGGTKTLLMAQEKGPFFCCLPGGEIGIWDSACLRHLGRPLLLSGLGTPSPLAGPPNLPSLSLRVPRIPPRAPQIPQDPR